MLIILLIPLDVILGKRRHHDIVALNNDSIFVDDEDELEVNVIH
jgi:hypothetical protein